MHRGRTTVSFRVLFHVLIPFTPFLIRVVLKGYQSKSKEGFVTILRIILNTWRKDREFTIYQKKKDREFTFALFCQVLFFFSSFFNNIPKFTYGKKKY